MSGILTTDIAGLREQIKGTISRRHFTIDILTARMKNATLLFPNAVKHYLEVCPGAINKHDAFNFFIRTTGGLLIRRYQAVLTCGVWRIISGQEWNTIDVAAAGDSASQVYDAVMNLLDVVTQPITRKLFSIEGVNKAVLAEGKGRYLDVGVTEVRRAA